MAATLELQNVAKKNDMKHIIGYSLTFVSGDDKVEAKIYCQTNTGLANLLRIQKAIGVDNVSEKTISLIDLMRRGRGNVIVIGKMMGEWMAENDETLKDIANAFDNVYFQVDLSEYRADRIDVQLMNSQKCYFDNFYIDDKAGHSYRNNIRPVLIQDMYYLDDDEWKSKIILNKIDIGAAHEQSRRQFMKTLDEMFDEFDELFSDKYTSDVFYEMCEATVEIAENANASYDLESNFMPEYIMTPDEKKRYKNNHDMFLRLVENGFKKYVPDGMEEIYRKRLDYEVRILEETDSIDYLLVQYDTVNWARKNGILVGVGRGSAGGSLILYLLGITLIDPIKYDLIFERFLIPERAGLEQADVTSIKDDVQSSNYVSIELENGRIYKFDCDSMFLVKRQGETKPVYADELMDGDDIIFDNKDLLFSLNEIGYENKEG